MSNRSKHILASVAGFLLLALTLGLVLVMLSGCASVMREALHIVREPYMSYRGV